MEYLDHQSSKPLSPPPNGMEWKLATVNYSVQVWKPMAKKTRTVTFEEPLAFRKEPPQMTRKKCHRHLEPSDPLDRVVIKMFGLNMEEIPSPNGKGGSPA
jgi:hypothetical protein